MTTEIYQHIGGVIQELHRLGYDGAALRNISRYLLICVACLPTSGSGASLAASLGEGQRLLRKMDCEKREKLIELARAI